ncbi:MAG: ferrochelatase, partial [Gammaproteobacteria bacterium]|nr:ferrochelatase [Gammaproteobacteria bacterium]
VLVVSFGGPEGPDDVMPFLDNVFRGLRVTDETKQKIAARYHDFGGVSPINGHTREFISALQRLLDHEGPSLPIYWGNRNWHPLLRDTITQMAADGIGRAIVYVTSTFSSYSGCRKYREDLYEATAGIDGAPELDKLRVGFNHPGFVKACAVRVAEALAKLPAKRRAAAKLLFTAHSLPESMAANSPYVAQLDDACAAVAAEAKHDDFSLVFQSNNARYGGEPWLGPDVGDALESLAGEGFGDVVVMPIGFVCDHMEVVLDLDVDAAARADKAGINMVRAGTVGSHPDYVAMVRDLIVERMAGGSERKVVGALPPKHDWCPADCCLSGRPGPVKESLCGTPFTLVPSGGANAGGRA